MWCVTILGIIGLAAAMWGMYELGKAEGARAVMSLGNPPVSPAPRRS